MKSNLASLSIKALAEMRSNSDKADFALDKVLNEAKRLQKHVKLDIVKEAIWCVGGYHLDSVTVVKSLKRHGITAFNFYHGIKEMTDQLVERQTKLPDDLAHKKILYRIADEVGITRYSAEYSYQHDNVLVARTNDGFIKISDKKLYDDLIEYAGNKQINSALKVKN